MSFHHKGIEYFIGLCATTFTISIPAFKNYFKVLEVKKVDTVHAEAKVIIENELLIISKEEKYNGRR
ncbi:hypothetical protein ACFQO9_11165 [Chryseobacterium zhengzhouense]|uniref:Uncharacterized protein n=1 Tax=Chryseobacterium zhengzhouense TaxID=1636086 RepID=A0ABW2LYJ9_9FLAO